MRDEARSTSPSTAASSAWPARTARRTIFSSSPRTSTSASYELRGKFGEIGDARLTVMAALTVADELAERQEASAALEEELAALQDARVPPPTQPAPRQAVAVAAFNSAAERIEGIAKKLNQTGADRRRALRWSRPRWSGMAGAAANALHCRGGAAGCVRSTIPRGLTILKGAVPGRAPGPGHMAPTYLCRFPGSHSDGHRGSALAFMPSGTGIDSVDAATTASDRRRSRPTCAAPRSRGATRCRPPSARGRGRGRSRRGRSRVDHARRDRVGLFAAQERDQSGAADAQARGGRRDAGVAGGGGPRQAADHARLGVRRGLGAGVWGIREPKAERPRSIPTS